MNSNQFYLFRINCRKFCPLQLPSIPGGFHVKEGVCFIPRNIVALKIVFVYLIRLFETIFHPGIDNSLARPVILTIWFRDRFVGHLIEFFPRRGRFLHFSGGAFRELTYSIEEAYRGLGLGSYLVSLSIHRCFLFGCDLVGVVNQNNYASCSVFRKFDASRAAISRGRWLFFSTYLNNQNARPIFQQNWDYSLEKARYNIVSQRYTEVSDEVLSLLPFGAAACPVVFQTPYHVFESYIKELVKPGMLVLELGAGTGNFSGVVARMGARLIAMDISEQSLRILSARIGLLGRPVEMCIGDVARIPFARSSIDLVVSAGSLSYGHADSVMREILRVLKVGGYFVCVDSLNDNPIYSINRYFHWLRGNRTKSTLINMPTFSLIKEYKHNFGFCEVRYFGSIAYLSSLLQLFLGGARARAVMDFIDRAINVKRSAFKFVLTARKEQNG